MVKQEHRLEALKEQLTKKAILKTPKKIMDKQGTMAEDGE